MFSDGMPELPHYLSVKAFLTDLFQAAVHV